MEVENQYFDQDGKIFEREEDRHVKVWGHLAETEVEWIAVELLRPDGTRELTTFLDEGFYDDWGKNPSPRLIEDCGYLRNRLVRKTGRRRNHRGSVRRADRSLSSVLPACASLKSSRTATEMS